MVRRGRIARFLFPSRWATTFQSGSNAIILPPMTPQDITKLIVRVSLRDRAAFDLLYRADQRETFRRLPACLEGPGRGRGGAAGGLRQDLDEGRPLRGFGLQSDLVAGGGCAQSCDRPSSVRGDRPAADIDAALDIADPAPGPEAMAVAGGEERAHRQLPRRTGKGPGGRPCAAPI